MPSDLTIVKYSYVRDPERTPFPRIKSRRVDEFRAQLDHVAANYDVVTADQVMAAVLGEDDLPPRACWLIFENGYADHYEHVLPMLVGRGWQGSFYVPSRAVTDRKVLDVNKIHFVLAAVGDARPLVKEIHIVIEEWRAAGVSMPSFEQYWNTHARANRWDSAEVIFVKRMLQKGLPEHPRAECVSRLFRRYVTNDPAAFAAQLYLDTEQLLALRDTGMHLGSHGAAHLWLDTLDEAGQAADLDESLAFLNGLGVGTDRWTMCYPQGAYDETTLRLLRERHCTVGFTNDPGPGAVPGHPPLELPTLDTNDLPADG